MESESLWLKIDRALEHFEAVKDAIAQDISTYGGRFTVEAEGKETLNLLEPGPLISLRVGEFVYQMRSTLDHLAFDLVKMNSSGISPPADWEENCAFPTWYVLKRGQTTPLPYGTFKALPGIPMEAHALIESVQPYYPTGAANTSLRLLNKLSNIDKHRRFALTRTRAKVHQRTIHKSGRMGYSLETLEHGAEIPPPFQWDYDPVVDVKTTTELTIAFDELDALGDASGVPIDYLLETILGEIWRGVFDPLRKLLK